MLMRLMIGAQEEDFYEINELYVVRWHDKWHFRHKGQTLIVTCIYVYGWNILLVMTITCENMRNISKWVCFEYELKSPFCCMRKFFLNLVHFDWKNGEFRLRIIKGLVAQKHYCWWFTFLSITSQVEYTYVVHYYMKPHSYGFTNSQSLLLLDQVFSQWPKPTIAWLSVFLCSKLFNVLI